MKARVKVDSRITVVTAFGGFTYVRNTWANVPQGQEEAARHHPLLEVDEVEAEDVFPEPVKELVILEPEPEKALILDEIHSEPEPEEVVFEPLPVYREEEKPKPKVSKRVRRP